MHSTIGLDSPVEAADADKASATFVAGNGQVPTVAHGMALQDTIEAVTTKTAFIAILG
jgi:hypothetical protein